MSQYNPPPPGQGGDLLFSYQIPTTWGWICYTKIQKYPPPLGLVNEDEYDSSHLKLLI